MRDAPAVAKSQLPGDTTKTSRDTAADAVRRHRLVRSPALCVCPTGVCVPLALSSDSDVISTSQVQVGKADRQPLRAQRRHLSAAPAEGPKRGVRVCRQHPGANPWHSWGCVVPLGAARVDWVADGRRRAGAGAGAAAVLHGELLCVLQTHRPLLRALCAPPHGLPKLQCRAMSVAWRVS